MRAVLFLLVFSAGAIGMAGPDAMGRLALRAEWDRVAVALLSDDAARGVALYRLGDHAGADRAFAAAGRSQTYNRGLSLAATGDYPLAVAYFDAVLFANPADAQARANRDLVAAMFPPHQGQSIAPGRLAGGGGMGLDTAPISGQLARAPGENLQRPLDRRGLVASDAWLETIIDDPGEFLRLRIAAEFDRRAQQGLIRPEEGDPW